MKTKQPNTIPEIEAVITAINAALNFVKNAAELDKKTFHLTHIRNSYQACIDDLESEIGAMNLLIIRTNTIGK